MLDPRLLDNFDRFSGTSSFSIFDIKTDMNSHFLSAVAPYIKKEVLTHQQQVCRLYKHSLKCLMSWSTDRDIFMEKATELRKRFRDNASLDPNSPQLCKLCLLTNSEAKALLEAGLKEYEKMAHPDPYVRKSF